MLKEGWDAMEAMGRMMEVEDEPDEGRAAARRWVWVRCRKTNTPFAAAAGPSHWFGSRSISIGVRRPNPPSAALFSRQTNRSAKPSCGLDFFCTARIGSDHPSLHAHTRPNIHNLPLPPQLAVHPAQTQASKCNLGAGIVCDDCGELDHLEAKTQRAAGIGDILERVHELLHGLGRAWRAVAGGGGIDKAEHRREIALKSLVGFGRFESAHSLIGDDLLHLLHAPRRPGDGPGLHHARMQPDDAKQRRVVAHEHLAIQRDIHLATQPFLHLVLERRVALGREADLLDGVLEREPLAEEEVDEKGASDLVLFVGGASDVQHVVPIPRKERTEAVVPRLQIVEHLEHISRLNATTLRPIRKDAPRHLATRRGQIHKVIAELEPCRQRPVVHGGGHGALQTDLFVEQQGKRASGFASNGVVDVDCPKEDPLAYAIAPLEACAKRLFEMQLKLFGEADHALVGDGIDVEYAFDRHVVDERRGSGVGMFDHEDDGL
ncbi:hypothetical protein L1887_54114 [Cichorium endivia]|nr:hypothetical protein L1887_54114 [Cichorium endivia]